MPEWYESSQAKRDEQDANDAMMLLGYVVKHGEIIKQVRAEMRERLERVEKRQEELDAKVVELGEVLKQILEKLDK